MQKSPLLLQTSSCERPDQRLIIIFVYTGTIGLWSNAASRKNSEKLRAIKMQALQVYTGDGI